VLLETFLKRDVDIRCYRPSAVTSKFVDNTERSPSFTVTAALYLMLWAAVVPLSAKLTYRRVFKMISGVVRVATAKLLIAYEIEIS